ncbi:MAG: multiheme c-type cytochrome [Sphingomonadaceae bacterium]
MPSIVRIATNAKAAIAVALCVVLGAAALFIAISSSQAPAIAALPKDAKHLGVASCSGSTCHGRSQPDGAVVRQDEIMRWQEASSAGGAHSRALAILSQPRSEGIARRLGIGNAATAPMCLGCHSENAALRGPQYQQSDGVGCEACHGGSANWIDVHKAGNRTASLSAGLINLSNPAVKASVCLDCHYGSADGGQFVTHRIMAAGHPRISFELDLFSALQQHHNEDADYAARKGKTNNVRVWAVGQAMALERSLSLYANPGLGTEGAFPEFYFLDCHSCHRRIYDDQAFTASVTPNPGRPASLGMPPYNDENMIMLLAAARIAAPALAQRFDAESKAFHAAFSKDRAAAIAAGNRLRSTATALATAFQTANFDRGKTFAVIDLIASDAISDRFTDYSGSVQSVMAVDTLLNALVNAGQVAPNSVVSIRGDVNSAYAAVREPNDYRPSEFRRALGSAVRAIRLLR